MRREDHKLEYAPYEIELLATFGHNGTRSNFFFMPSS